MNIYYYDQPYLSRGGGEQREFGVINSKVIRPFKSKAGRLRRKAAEALYRSGDNALIESREATSKLKDGVKNKELRNNILRNEAPKLNTTVSLKAKNIASQGGGGAQLPKENITNLGRSTKIFPRDPNIKLVKKIVKKEGRKSGIAFNEQEVGVEILAHELGHARGKVVGGRRGRISKADPRKVERGSEYQGSLTIYSPSYRPNEGASKVKFKDAVKDYFKNRKNSKAIIAEEMAASKDGLEMLKRNGATKEELSKAAENLKVAGDTYKTHGKKARRSSLGRIIDIPSRRGHDLPFM